MSRVAVTSEQRFGRTPDGAVWAPFFSYSFWTRYLTVFEEVRVIARLRDVPRAPSGCRQADGEGVSFAPVPYYHGPWQYLIRAPHVRVAVRRAVLPSDAVILRVDSQLAAVLEPSLRKDGHPYGVEVVSDPEDTFVPGAFDHPLRPLFRWRIPRQMARQCAGAVAAAYVTECALQRRYPPADGAFTTHFSSAELPPEAFVSHPRVLVYGKRPVVLVTVGTMDDRRKRQDVVISAVKTCVDEGLDLRLCLVGDGRRRPECEALVTKYKLRDRVVFAGQVASGDAVREYLDRADVFVLPSNGEGLPRAMIEAMARGLPGIGSRIAGYFELLPPEDLVPPGDVRALSEKIREVVSSPGRLASMSARNLEKAREYSEAVLRARRDAFYQYLKERTSAWYVPRKR